MIDIRVCGRTGSRRRRAVGSFVLAVALCLTGQLRAQEPVYGPEDLTQQPRLVSAMRSAELLRQAGKGMTGTVRLQFIVDGNGRVEPESVTVVESTNDALTPAAQTLAAKLEFRAGEKNGRPVRTRVMLPLIFQK